MIGLKYVAIVFLFVILISIQYTLNKIYLLLKTINSKLDERNIL